MLLRDYLLLNLGAATREEAQRWQNDMIGRRRVDATRDLLAFWRPGGAERPQLVASPVVSLRRRFGQMLPLQEFADGLLEAARRALAEFRVEAEAQGRKLAVDGRGVAAVEAEMHGEEVASGALTFDLAVLQELLGREVHLPALTNAAAYHFEQIFGYAQAAKHPVAYEEAMRPTQG